MRPPNFLTGFFAQDKAAQQNRCVHSRASNAFSTRIGSLRSITMLKVIFFDAAGTLIHLPRSVGEHYREVALRFGVDVPAVRFDEAFRSAWKSAPARGSNHQPREDDDKAWWRALVTRVLTHALSTERAADFDTQEFFEELYAHFAKPGVWAAYTDVWDVLVELHERGLALAIISNFDRRLYAILEHLQLAACFERIVISSEIGADKPDPFIFQYALEAMRVDPAEAVHVGDDPRCDWGAEAVGLCVFRLERPAMTLRDLIPLLNDHAV